MKHQTVLDASVSILSHLATHGEATQIQLTGINRLKRTAIFYVFDALQAAGFVRDEEKPIHGRGRPSRLWFLNEQAGHFVSAYFDTFHNYYGLYDFAGHEVARAVTDATPDIEAALADLEKQLASWPIRHLCGISAGLSGIIDSANGIVRKSRRWSLVDYPLGQRLAERFQKGQPPLVIVDNNARLAAWGEHTVGVTQTLHHFLTLHLHGGRNATRTRPLGLGSGMVLDGRLFRGHHGTAGELDISFYQWLEAHTSHGNLPSSLRDLTAAALDSFAESLGATFAHLVNYLSPQGVVLVFDQEPRNDRFCAAFEDALRSHLLNGNAVACDVRVSVEGEQIVLPGGADLLRRRYFAKSPQFVHYLEGGLSRVAEETV